MEMEDHHSGKELVEGVLEVAPDLEQKSNLSMNGMDSFTIDALARELNMDDAEGKRELTTIVGQLVNEGRLIGHTKDNHNLSIGSG